jgi:hypothetical protein
LPGWPSGSIGFLASTSWIGLGIYFYGRSKILVLHYIEEKGAEPLGH